MRILVVEDTPNQIAAARQQLVGHDTTFITTYNEFEELLGGRYEDNGVLRQFDAALLDIHILMETDSREIETGPFGLVIALKCLASGIPMVGIITDTNHHMDSVARSLDLFAFNYTNGQRFTTGQTNVAIAFGSGGLVDGCEDQEGNKNFARLLELLQNQNN